MTRPLVLAGAAAVTLLALAGTLRAAGGRRGGGDVSEPRLVFSHEKHVGGLDVQCVKCHEESRNHRVPAESACAPCHDQVRGGLDPACAMCHEGADPAALAPGESLQRGQGFEPEIWRCIDALYDHGLHARESTCLACHPDAPRSRRAADDLYPRRRTFCGVCHADDPCRTLPPAGEPLPSRSSSTRTEIRDE